MSGYSWAIALDPKLTPAHNNLGNALADKGRLDEAMAEYRQVIALDPKEAKAHFNLGNALRAKGRWDEAIAEYRQAIALDPKDAKCHSNLGNVLAGKGRWDEAMAEQRQAIALDPEDATFHSNLGSVLAGKGRWDEAIAECRQAIALDPKLPQPHNNLGNALQAKGRWDEVIAEYRHAIALDPKNATVHHNLGSVLAGKERWDEAIAEWRQAIALDPKLFQAHAAMGQALLLQGRYATAKESTRRALELLPTDAPLHRFVVQQLQECDRLLVLEKKLPTILSGEASPANPGEAITLAWMCQQHKKQHVAAARLYVDAFAAEWKLFPVLQQQHRYNAACSAALAAAGEGEDARLLPDKAVCMFRRWALDWLRDDLTAQAKLADQNNPEVKQAIQQQLAHWRIDPDLASVRDPQALDRLADNERAAWQALWRDVDELAKRVAKKDEPTTGRKEAVTPKPKP
jgi:tetratricopeptide (TPR) repeat protein